MDWPPQSPVLNPIKNVWEARESYLGRKYEKTGDLEMLKWQLKEAYNLISADKIKEFIYSTPFCMQQVIDRAGRRYHQKSKDQYLLPSDEIEQDRLDLVHHLHLELLNGNITLTKFDEDPEFGDIHTGSEVIGLDLAPIRPGWTAPNVKFELDDLEKKWAYPKDHFNFIHSSNVDPRLAQVSSSDIQRTIDTFFCDDDTMPYESPSLAYWRAMTACYEKLGISPRVRGEDYKRMAEEVRFKEVKVYSFKVPVGDWPRKAKLRRLGAIVAKIATTGAEAYASNMLTNFGGFTLEETKKLVDDAITLQRGPQLKEHAYYFEYFVTGRKPVAGCD
ncbi:hypothetical protein EX30DRAFT_374115 [Ascodesmis nigricans]|uniref:S-adenosyl-L-methionine-dependent methyltransferase n=1 Tax=Ascodesmis nigricans TaxID=341454 RepID=A0A4S2MR55_9PEZI|nr:hypothetical protein EX30DRAFT_374115 [Ascodesmis nigricans]